MSTVFTDYLDSPAIEMTGIVKRFPGVIAVDNVDFTVARGEIHALLGENGAGKSTLMQVLSGRLTPEQGRISLFGNRLSPGLPKAAIEAGLGMVYQKFMLVGSLTVAENLLLGRSQGLGINIKQVSEQIDDLGRRFGLEVDPKAKVWQLSVGECQRVEIIRLLLFNAHALVLDEPTAVLTPQEAEELFNALVQLKSEGRSVVFISHKMDEVMALADSITVLSRGRQKACMSINETDKNSLARLMIEGDWEPNKYQTEACAISPEVEPIIELQGVTVKGDLGLTSLDKLDLAIRPGEMVGLAGVAGNGQRELAQVCCGERAPVSGRILIKGKDLTGRKTSDFINAGVGLVPEDRHSSGSVSELNLIENLMLKDYQNTQFKKGVWLNWPEAKQRTDDLIKEFNIRPANPETKAGALSGGNLQKLILARELARKPQLVVASYPLRGLDLASAVFVQNILAKHRDQGSAVLFIGEDLDTLLEVSDRVIVLFRGRIMANLFNNNLSRQRLGLLMAGDETLA